MPLTNFKNETMKISYLIAVHNEHVELRRLLEQLIGIGDSNMDNEIIIQGDQGKVTDEVVSVIRWALKDSRVKYIEYPLKKDFAGFKNNLIRQATGDYCFLIDADELIHPNLLLNVKEILANNSEVEMFILPRFNVVKGLTPDYSKSQGWNVVTMNIEPDEFLKSIGTFQTVQLVNPFDPQQRIWKNLSTIRYEGSVHERLTGYKTQTQFEPDLNWMIYHIKSIDRQKKQNEFYETIQK